MINFRTFLKNKLRENAENSKVQRGKEGGYDWVDAGLYDEETDHPGRKRWFKNGKEVFPEDLILKELEKGTGFNNVSINRTLQKMKNISQNFKERFVEIWNDEIGVEYPNQMLTLPELENWIKKVKQAGPEEYI